ncbi:DUF6330 family protein [Pukyongiella litopenaei]|uniref:Uncharacterized protein n=1 Tax=Pukyongiella litopenaei TaxID=2605946 RepID=A0A5C2H9W9_9RHOB|nr:DUF6330 family protein [Pukyongiella litopenaei]QEP30589.1 hypothetical protein C6Y53_20510 [Pukyongiella litopenaei]
MQRYEPKTLKVVCFPDGARYVIRFRNGAWWWSRSEGAYPLSALVETIEERGGWIERIPNPNHRPRRLLDL